MMKRSIYMSVLLSTVTAFTTTAATAQSAPAVEDAATTTPQEPAPSEIVVTASRVNRAGYAAPTPTVVVGAEQLATRATTNIGQFLAEVPSFRPTTQPTSNGVNQRSIGSNYVDLRGLGTSRTLVLVDGQRFVPEMAAGLAGYNVNLNQIPSLLVDRVEVVTGGASAQWGSDAVAGVVNILLKKKFNGFNAELQSGVSTYGDNSSVRAGFVAGRNFADNRANVTIAVDYEKNNGVGDVNSRAWGRKHYFLLPNPCPNSIAVSAACPTGGNGQASNLILPDAQFAGFAPGGLITNTALRGTAFGVGGTTVPFSFGQFVSTNLMQGGSQPGINYSNIQPIAAPYSRVQTYARGSYELSDAIEAHAEGSYAFSRGGGVGQPYLSTTTIRSDNAYLPANISARMTAAGVTSFTLGRYNAEFTSTGRVTNETIRGVFGLQGRIAEAGNWKWEANAGYGENRYRQRVRSSTITQRFGFAADAVVNNGQIVCRATLPGTSFNAAAAGCVPVNLFGTGSVTGQGLAYITGTASANIDYRQFFANGELSGEPLSTWAGPVSMVVGAEYRRETEKAVADPIGNANGFNGNNSASFNGVMQSRRVSPRS